MEKAPTILFVTHHAEEITKSFSHVLLLKEGQSFAQGPKEEILTQETLSAFLRGKGPADSNRGRTLLYPARAVKRLTKIQNKEIGSSVTNLFSSIKAETHFYRFRA